MEEGEDNGIKLLFRLFVIDNFARRRNYFFPQIFSLRTWEKQLQLFVFEYFYFLSFKHMIKGGRLKYHKYDNSKR